MYTKEEYKSDISGLHADALSGMDTFFGNGGRLLKAGNSKLGARGSKGIMLVTSGLAYHDCPGKTDACVKICYAMAFHYLMFLSKRQGGNHIYSYLAHKDLGKLETILTSELTASSANAKLLKTPLVVRIHEAGDYVSVAHIDMWESIARSFPDVTFYGYTHSFKDEAMADAIKRFNLLPNVSIRRSYDSDSVVEAKADPNPVAFVDGSIKGNGTVDRKVLIARSEPHKGVVRCPEQLTGGKVNCTDCGLCWNQKKVPVQFFRH